MTACAQCGLCCEVIGIRADPAYYQRDPKDIVWPGDEPEAVPLIFHEFMWIKQHFHPISIEEAIAINPHIVDETTREGHSYYTCDAYDKETKLCTAHDDRPAICRDFPWYGKSVNPYNLKSFPRCSYWRDLPRSLWPPGVDPLPDPSVQLKNVC
jgi:Fe-S-cluster containining protein